jgi:hypothetical protein
MWPFQQSLTGSLTSTFAHSLVNVSAHVHHIGGAKLHVTGTYRAVQICLDAEQNASYQLVLQRISRRLKFPQVLALACILLGVVRMLTSSGSLTTASHTQLMSVIKLAAKTPGA